MSNCRPRHEVKGKKDVVAKTQRDATIYEYQTTHLLCASSQKSPDDLIEKWKKQVVAFIRSLNRIRSRAASRKRSLRPLRYPAILREQTYRYWVKRYRLEWLEKIYGKQQLHRFLSPGYGFILPYRISRLDIVVNGRRYSLNGKTYVNAYFNDIGKMAGFLQNIDVVIKHYYSNSEVGPMNYGLVALLMRLGSKALTGIECICIEVRRPAIAGRILTRFIDEAIERARDIEKRRRQLYEKVREERIRRGQKPPRYRPDNIRLLLRDAEKLGLINKLEKRYLKGSLPQSWIETVKQTRRDNKRWWRLR